MKPLLFFFILILSQFVLGQNESNSRFFVQAVVHFDDATEYQRLEELYRNDARLELVRVDPYSGRIFLLTQDLQSFNSEDFKEVSAAYFERLKCYKIGVKGIDTISEQNYHCEE